MLHHYVGEACFGRPAVEHSHQIRMVESRQQAAMLVDTRGEFPVEGIRPDHLDQDMRSGPVIESLRQVNGACCPLLDCLDYPVRSDVGIEGQRSRMADSSRFVGSRETLPARRTVDG